MSTSYAAQIRDACKRNDSNEYHLLRSLEIERWEQIAKERPELAGAINVIDRADGVCFGEGIGPDVSEFADLVDLLVKWVRP